MSGTFSNAGVGLDRRLWGRGLLLISLKHLKINKKASGRHQDLADLDALS